MDLLVTPEMVGLSLVKKSFLKLQVSLYLIQVYADDNFSSNKQTSALLNWIVLLAFPFWAVAEKQASIQRKEVIF